MSSPTAADDDVLRTRFAAFAETTASRAPLYSRLSRAVADDPECRGILLAAPPTQQQPVLLFAAAHHILLRNPDEELARHYPNLSASVSTTDPEPAFRDFCIRRGPELRELVATRHTQTNEVGRCAVLLPALAVVTNEAAEPLALLDVGASSGLNLLLDRYRYVYTVDFPMSATERPEPTVVGEPSPVVLECGIRGEAPIPRRLPPIAARLGLDQSPVDLGDADAARWLEACVWPDQLDRFERLRAAIRLAGPAPPAMLRGDAVDDLPAAIDQVGQHGHPTVVNSWVLSYLTADQRSGYFRTLDTIGSRRDISWVYLESPEQIEPLPVPDDPATAHLTTLTLVRWRGGRRTVEHLATAHPHGYWLHWH